MMGHGRIRLAAWVLGLAALATAAGCNGVTMNAEYSQLLDQTEAMSDEAAKRAQAGTLSESDKTAILRLQADTWVKFQDARDGKSNKVASPTTAAAAK